MPLVENTSILMSIKKLLNVEHNDTAFDTDIGMNINGVFMTLHQLGIGPDDGFFIIDADTKWSDFSKDKTLIETVKMYVYLKVRMIFDPPASSIVADAINNRIEELEWRLNIQAERDYGKSDDPDVQPSPSPEDDRYEIEDENMRFFGSLQNLVQGGADPE